MKNGYKIVIIMVINLRLIKIFLNSAKHINKIKFLLFSDSTNENERLQSGSGYLLGLRSFWFTLFD